MSNAFRKPEILEIARFEGKVLVEELAARFDVTVQTIRRDLSELADAGKLERVHGGAIFPPGFSNIRYEDRRSLNEDAKTAIAKTCAQNIPDGSSVFLNIGTSTEAVAHELLHHRNLLVMTNNLNVANILMASKECDIILAGGELRRSDGGLVGRLTIQTIEQFKFDFAVIGCSALDDDGDLLDFDIQEVGVSQTIINQSRTVLLVADHAKIARGAPARIASLKDIDTFFTDKPLPMDLQHKCVAWGTSIKLVDTMPAERASKPDRKSVV